MTTGTLATGRARNIPRKPSNPSVPYTPTHFALAKVLVLASRQYLCKWDIYTKVKQGNMSIVTIVSDRLAGDTSRNSSSTRRAKLPIFRSGRRLSWVPQVSALDAQKFYGTAMGAQPLKVSAPPAPSRFPAGKNASTYSQASIPEAALNLNLLGSYE